MEGTTVDVGDGSTVTIVGDRNPLLRQPLVSVKADHPAYPPEAFDAEGFLLVSPDWVCPPHQVVGWLERSKERRDPGALSHPGSFFVPEELPEAPVRGL